MPSSKAETARSFLSMLREDHAKLRRSDEYYIPLAAKAGVSMDEIVSLTGLPEEQVAAVIEVSSDGT